MAGRLELLGRITLHGTRTAAGLPGRRAELVFAYLAAEHHRVVSQDELADALWPDTLPDSWAAALRSVLSEVRRFLEDAGLEPADVLATARRGYRLALPEDVVVDLDEARAGLALARASLDGGDGAAGATHAGRAATLAGLPFLPNHDGDWVDGIRRELESLRARALELEAQGHRAAGDLTAAAGAAERLVRAEPFNEAGHRLRIRILGEAGDRAGAVRAYEHCRAVLADELAVEPVAETTAALEQALRAGAARAQLPAARPPAARQPAGPESLGDLSVLVVEDHDFQRRTVVRLLDGIGVGRVSAAGDGAAALELLTGAPQPDVIICDIDMPGIDGVEFIRRVAERGLASGVVIVSGLDSKVLDAVKAIGEAQGIQVLGALEKPLTSRRLAELLGSYRRHPARPSPGVEPAVTPGEVADALAEGRITMLFVPVVDLAECRVSGAETRPRLAHPVEGAVAPEVFVPLLAERGLMERYTDALLLAACTSLRATCAAGLNIGVGLDVAPAVLGDVELADRFLDAVRRGGADPSGITCEVADHTLPGAPPIALDVMTRLRVKGFGLALDHFGIRRPTRERLAHLPLTEVKLDASLVSGAAARGEQLLLLEETLDVARSLTADVVAGGCRTEADFDLLVEMGVRYVSGPFLGDAMTAEELVEWAPTWSPPTSDAGAAR